MSSVAYSQSAQNSLYELSSWSASAWRIWKAEMLTNSVFAVPSLSATILAARFSPIMALFSVPPTFRRIPSPSSSMLQHVTNATPCCSAFSICLATASRLTALRITASAPWRSAVSNAFWSCSGEPSVPIVSAVQPRSAAPCLMMSPWISQASTPQLMNATFLPAGTSLPIAFVNPSVVGRVVAFSAMRLRLGHSRPTALSGRAALRFTVAASGHRDERGAEHERSDEVPQSMDRHALLLLLQG